LQTTPDGGAFTTDDGRLTVAWPSDLPSTVTLTYTPQLSPTQGAGTLQLAGISFHLDATNAAGQPLTVLSPPLTLTVHYTEAALPAGLDEALLEVRRYDAAQAQWVPLVVLQRNLLGDELSVRLDHLSEFALLQPSEYLLYLPITMRSSASHIN
jgi:hypothetical protein